MDKKITRTEAIVELAELTEQFDWPMQMQQALYTFVAGPRGTDAVNRYGSVREMLITKGWGIRGIGDGYARRLRLDLAPDATAPRLDSLSVRRGYANDRLVLSYSVDGEQHTATYGSWSGLIEKITGRDFPSWQLGINTEEE